MEPGLPDSNESILLTYTLVFIKIGGLNIFYLTVWRIDLQLKYLDLW